MKKTLLALAVSAALAGCVDAAPASDKAANAQQEQTLKEAHSAVGMPALRNFREKRLLKMLYELRDQDGLRTYTYLIAQQSGKVVKLCDSMGYPLSDATGYTSPDKVVRDSNQTFGTVTQAEPNALFTPDSSNGYWVMCLSADKATPAFVTGDLVVTSYPMQ
jgi:hypothetical protein